MNGLTLEVNRSMSVSTFHGLEVARRGMMSQQAALYTTGHNIANANTPGYTRQRVNFEQTEPYPAPARNRPQMPGQLGTGVTAGEIQRIRDSFVDAQFRSENSKFGYWQAKADMLRQMEDIMNEPSDTGLAKSMDEFWNSLQDLAVQPQNDGARRVVRQRGIALANTFNYIYNSLKAVQSDYRNEIDITEKRINSLLRQINQVNKQIGAIEPHGYLPNDLYDERDRLVDELSTYINIKIVPKSSGGLASPNAEGLYDIYLATPEGDILNDGTNQYQLIDSSTHTAFGIYIEYNGTNLDSPVEQIHFYELKQTEEGFENTVDKYQSLSFSNFNTNGSLKGYIEGYGYIEGADVKGLYNKMLADLDEMAITFAEEFNKVHREGWSLHEIRTNTYDPNGYDFFDFGNPPSASNISVHQKILEDVSYIAAASNPTSGTANAGDGSNALNLANVKDAILNYGGSQTNVHTFYQGMIGSMGDMASEANRLSNTAAVLKESVDQRRMSIGNVSLDEEMTNMVKFQHAYNASARMITMIDEMLDKVINGMGVSGR